MESLTRWMIRRAGWISFFGLILSVLGGYYSFQLFGHLRTDLEELLPTTARSVLDLDQVTSRLESINNLAVLVRSKDTEASRRFVTDLAERLQSAPKDTVASVEYRIDRELKFFKERRPLYMETPDLERIRDYIRDRIDYEKQLYNPLNIFSGQELPEPKLDFTGMRKKYEGKASAYSRFPDGYYATPDGTKRVVLVNLAGRAKGIQGVHRLKDLVLKAVDSLQPSRYSPDLDISYTGDVQNTIEEQAALVADLALSTVVVIVLVAGAMLLFFRAFRATAALLLALFAGTLWTFGAAWFVVGYLNANSAFLGSIVLGNGINFGIILLARYLEERRRTVPHPEALRIAVSQTLTPTLAAALAAGLSYGSLILTGFRGFKQFGVIGLIGMILCWIATFTLIPALLTVFERFGPLVRPDRKVPEPKVASAVARAIQRRPAAIWFAALAFTGVSMASFWLYSPEIIETDFTKLRNKTSMEKGSGYLSRYVDEIFQRYLSPLVLLPRDRAAAPKLVTALKARQAEEAPRSLIANVQSLDDFLPRDQEAKIHLLEDIRKLLPPRLMRRISDEDRNLVKEFLDPAAFRKIELNDLPRLVLDKFTERDGTVGKMVLVEPPLKTLNGNELIHLVHQLRDTADQIAPGTPVAGSLPISSDMIEAILRDGPRATLFAFLAVIGLVIVLFRNVRTVALCLMALMLGVIWLAGLVLGLGLKINFLNFIALPITFGIGIDYGVNIFQRYRAEGPSSILRVIRETGGAVALCSFTTVVGYGSLLLAENQAFVSFGWLAVLGELTCLTAALFALPAYLLYSRQGRMAQESADSRRAATTSGVTGPASSS